MALTTALTGIVGTQIFVTANTTDAYGLQSTSPVVWTTSAASVATVQNIYSNSSGSLTNGGVITCLTAGTATITATAGSVTATFSLTVTTNTPGVATTIDIETSSSPTKLGGQQT